MAGISERRIDRLVNPSLNEDLPAFLAADAGLESGFMMIQVTAASLVAENRVLANPASPGSITTSGNKEDFVSMGMTSAIKLQQVVKNTRGVLAIEALTAARALDFLAPLKSGTAVERLARACVRRVRHGRAIRSSRIEFKQSTIGLPEEAPKEYEDCDSTIQASCASAIPAECC